ncbi:hypothetical protein Baya_0350 [Bagarius yarrelli]|uniref:Synaptotagmin-7 n=1 Tax=Bagarius yarrelli TaxID=175774 RepID=A0A556TI11_BAGYA|nr:hypothetical protein Baya_0350 [Bagarius yarrelli]
MIPGRLEISIRLFHFSCKCSSGILNSQDPLLRFLFATFYSLHPVYSHLMPNAYYRTQHCKSATRLMLCDCVRKSKKAKTDRERASERERVNAISSQRCFIISLHAMGVVFHFIHIRRRSGCTGSVALSVFLVSLAVTVCAVWLVALCGVCGWCQRKLACSKFKISVYVPAVQDFTLRQCRMQFAQSTAPSSSRSLKHLGTALSHISDPVGNQGYGKALVVRSVCDLDRDFWNNNDNNTEQQRWSSYPPKEFVLNISPYAPYGDPRLTLNGAVPGGQKGSLGGRGGDGEGPSRSDSVKSMMMGASRASRWQMAQGRAQSEDLRNSK